MNTCIKCGSKTVFTKICKNCMEDSVSKQLEENNKMSEKTHIAFYEPNWEYHQCESFEAAEKWIKDQIEEYTDSDEGYDEALINGRCFISEITHRSHFEIKEEKSDYCEMECYACHHSPDDCGEEPWPYNSDWEHAGEIVMKKL